MNVYADHAATTPMRACAKEAMLEALEDFGNPSSIHSAGRLAAVRLESARKEVAELLNCRPSEIYFTSGGTEADNWAIRAARYGDGHVVASAFEHHAIIHALEAMAREKERNVELVKPERDGIVDPERVRRNVSQYTNLVTVMAANNEVGTIQPVEEIGREIRKGGNKRTIFHTDAVQAVGHIPVDVQKMGVDMLSLSAHKFGGPKGVGVLYCRNGIILDPLLFGGGQERGNRPGTENTPGIVAMAVAMREACKNMESAAAKTRELRDRLIRRIKEIPDSYIHGSLEKRLPGNINCSFAGGRGGRGDHAGSGRCVRVVWFRLHIGDRGTEPRTDRHGTVQEGRLWGHTDHAGGNEYRGGSGLYRRPTGGNRPKIEGVTSWALSGSE